MYRYTVTYDISTPESAEQGDTAERGWYIPWLGHFVLEGPKGRNEGLLAEATAGAFDLEARTLRDLVDVLREQGASHRSGYSFYCQPLEPDYRDGSVECRAVHVPGLSEALLEALASDAGCRS